MTTDKELVQRSYGACCISPGFFDDFYAAFLASSDQIAVKFKHTDMAKQKQLLREGISFMVMYYDGTMIGRMKVEQLGQSHSQTRMDIKPQWYDLWLDALLATITKHDKEYSPTVARAWRNVLSKGIEAMRGQHAGQPVGV